MPLRSGCFLGVSWFREGAAHHQLGPLGWAGGRCGQLGSGAASVHPGFLALGWKQMCECVQVELCCFVDMALCIFSPSCRLFGGLVLDVKRKAPWFWSDFRDGLSLQCLASFLFLYCACMAPIITFGGLLGEATDGHIVSASLCWVAWGRTQLVQKSSLQSLGFAWVLYSVLIH